MSNPYGTKFLIAYWKSQGVSNKQLAAWFNCSVSLASKVKKLDLSKKLERIE